MKISLSRKDEPIKFLMENEYVHELFKSFPFGKALEQNSYQQQKICFYKMYPTPAPKSVIFEGKRRRRTILSLDSRRKFAYSDLLKAIFLHYLVNRFWAD